MIQDKIRSHQGHLKDIITELSELKKELLSIVKKVNMEFSELFELENLSVSNNLSKTTRKIFQVRAILNNRTYYEEIIKTLEEIAKEDLIELTNLNFLI